MSDDLVKRYWQDLNALGASATGRTDEFAEELPLDAASAEDLPRRGFFKVMGISAALVASSCSRSPVTKIIPFLENPEGVTAGTSLNYASSCGACPAQCGMVVKARDGRPIKLEGNAKHPASQGGLCAVGQASVLSLYDGGRGRKPTIGGAESTFQELDAQVVAGLKRISGAGGKIRVVAATDLGPTAAKALQAFGEAYPSSKRVRFDAEPYRQAIADAHQTTHGTATVPRYQFGKAKVIVGVAADFLGTWLSPVVFTRQYTAARDPRAGKMSRHYQLESHITLTGSNADVRHTMAPSDTVPVLAALAKRVAVHAGASVPASIGRAAAPELPGGVLDTIAADLHGARGAALVVCGSDDPAAQLITNYVNDLLGAYSATISLSEGVTDPAGSISFDEFFAELQAGEVKAVLFWNSNPAYSHPLGSKLGALLNKVELTVAANDRADETGALVKYLATDSHFLESWGDTEPYRGLVGVRQPALTSLFDTRPACESFLRWAGVAQSHYDYLRERWKSEVFPAAVVPQPSFEAYWIQSVQDGFALVTAPASADSGQPFRAGDFEAALGKASPRKTAGGDIEVIVYEKVGMRDGRMANSAWLQELPDPISKATWNNYACISSALAGKLGVVEGDLVSVKVADESIVVPALIEPGVHPRVVAVAAGYGRTAAGKIANQVGQNAFRLAHGGGVAASFAPQGGAVAKAGGNKPLAKSQTHASMEGRPLVQEATFAAFKKNPEAGRESEGKKHLSIWSGHKYEGHKWGMVIDLSACTGCSACIVGCQAENNIPVVGHDEVLRRREMHWLRIDRYFAGPEEEPEVVHQPMLCLHCENAPCETVCPVAATTHSSEGLNQQTYNRCVGTRYCANNCPTKVRRFNWFNYPHEDPLERMVLNPDVVVRERGVMEKCSMCVQRVQEGKAKAKADGRTVRDGDIETACQQSCPAQAIVFGDMNDPASRISELIHDGRNYNILEDLNLNASVSYLRRIRNPNSEGNHG